jgi:LacI family transcriptional regulator
MPDDRTDGREHDETAGTEPVSELTMRMLAKSLGLHQSTVSRALDPRRAGRVSERTRRRVFEAAENAGFRPDMTASALRRGRTHTVGLIVPDLGNIALVRVFRAFTRVVEEREFMPFITETRDDSRRLVRAIDHLLSRRVEAIVVMAARVPDREVLEAYQRRLPVVVAVRPLETSTLPVVAADEVLGGSLVAQHQIDRGHPTLAQLRGPDDVMTFRLRARGFSQTCTTAGVDEIELGLSARAPTAEEGSELMERIISERADLPDALFAHNDPMALGALSAMRRHGLHCPEDMALVGYNNIPFLDELETPLCSVEYPVDAIGEASGRLALELIENRPAIVPSSYFPPRLIVRASSAKSAGSRRRARGRATGQGA